VESGFFPVNWRVGIGVAITEGMKKNLMGRGTNSVSQHISVTAPMQGGEHVNEMDVIDTDSKPSWKRLGGGSMSIRLQTHTQAGWLQMTARETPDNGRGGKEVHVTLYKEAALELRDFLNLSFASIAKAEGRES
jgi:hypothetical protein